MVGVEKPVVIVHFLERKTIHEEGYTQRRLWWHIFSVLKGDYLLKRIFARNRARKFCLQTNALQNAR
jgi:hypothetical protein